MKDIVWGQEHFHVSPAIMQRVIGEALLKGGDYADLFFEHTEINQLVLRDGEVNSAACSVEFGAGVRVVDGDRTGYAYTENVIEPELMSAAQAARAIVMHEHGSYSAGVGVSPLSMPLQGTRYPMLQHWRNVLVSDKKPFLERINSRVFELDSRVLKVSVSLTDSVQYVLFYNSLGISYFDERPMVVLSVSCVMQEGERVEQNSSSRSFRVGAEFLTEALVEELAQEVVRQCAFLFQAEQISGGEMSVVMGAGGSGILLHEAIGHSFEADFIRKRTSIFSERLGEMICHPSINIVDDATIMGNRGSVNWDDEGVVGQQTYLVKNGRLNSFLHDRISARHFGIESTGNGRRESYKSIPIPRMRATYMENGDACEEELISRVTRGVFVDHFSNGEVQIGAGDFSFYVKSGYLIENGKLTKPIKDINVMGNGPQALADIEAVANNAMIDNGAWTCGKDGQGCPVTCGMPSVLVKSLVVG